MSAPSAVRQTSPPMRVILYVAAGLVMVAGALLFLLSEQTEIYFAWTIKSSLTAAFLGGGYLASVLVEFLAAREKVWARARISVIPVLSFTWLTLIVTLLHLDKFHFDVTRFQPVTIFITWVWMAVYNLVPPLLLGILIYQLRRPGIDESRQANFPAWLTSALGVQGGVLIYMGGLLFFAQWLFPATFADPNHIQLLPFWSWILTPLTAQAAGAWLIGLGLSSAWAAYEQDFLRTRIMTIGASLYCGLQFVALARYGSQVTWDIRGWGFVIFLLVYLGTNAYAWYTSRWAKRKDG